MTSTTIDLRDHASVGSPVGPVSLSSIVGGEVNVHVVGPPPKKSVIT
jgi:hypothetical protein